MDRAISASEANQQFSAMLREVEQGASFVVMSRGRAVARVLPADPGPTGEAVERLLDFLGELPRRNGGDWRRDDLYA